MKRKITTILVLALAFTTLQLSAKSQLKNPFKQMKKVLRAIHEPKFPNREYQMLDYYNGTDSLYTAAINEAINTCSQQGGGHVIIPDGTNSTFDNDYMDGETTYKYYNEIMWPKRIADCISLDEALGMMER